MNAYANENQSGQLVKLLKRSELAKSLSCSIRTIDNLQAQGMPCVRLGSSRRFIFTEVISWLRRKGGR